MLLPKLEHLVERLASHRQTSPGLNAHNRRVLCTSHRAPDLAPTCDDRSPRDSHPTSPSPHLCIITGSFATLLNSSTSAAPFVACSYVRPTRLTRNCPDRAPLTTLCLRLLSRRIARRRRTHPRWRRPIRLTRGHRRVQTRTHRTRRRPRPAPRRPSASTRSAASSRATSTGSRTSCLACRRPPSPPPRRRAWRHCCRAHLHTISPMASTRVRGMMKAMKRSTSARTAPVQTKVSRRR